MSDNGKQPIQFTESCELRALDTWHREIEKNRGDRALLRRCRGPIEVALTPAFHALVAAVRPCGVVDPLRLALVAGVVAHTDVVDGPVGSRFAQQMAADRGGRPLVSDLRFRRLLAEDDPGRLYEMTVRLVRQLDRYADQESLARGLYQWNSATKMRWARDYYGRAPVTKKEGET